MAPPIPTFHVSSLATETNVLGNGKARKQAIDLDQSPLKEMVQYKCNVAAPKAKGDKPTIVCEPVVRFYRQCADGFSVETTAWEGWRARETRKEVVPVEDVKVEGQRTFQNPTNVWTNVFRAERN